MCTFVINYGGTPAELVETAKGMIEEAGGTFDGGEERGRYTVNLALGQVHGEYDLQPGAASFRITKKPMLVPCAAIEAFLRAKIR